MGFPDVGFVKQQGGLGRALQGSDYLSAELFFSAALPSGFTTTLNKKQVFQVSDAEALGINTSYSDETPATGTYLISTKGNTGDTITINITVPSVTGVSTVVNLGTYTVGSSDTTIALQGAAWAVIINAGTYSHGYSASFLTATLTITAAKGLGIALNSGTPIAVVLTGAFAGTITQFTSGTYSKLALWHYRIAEYFRLNPQGNLWLGFYPIPTTYDFAELQDLARFAGGTIRQCEIYHLVARSAAQVASDCTAIQASQAILETAHMPMSVIYSPNIAAIADLSTLTNLGLLAAPKTSLCIAQDGLALGASLYLTSGVSVSAGAALLGAVSSAPVNVSIAWTQVFNISNGVEYNTPAFANGQLNTAISANLKIQLNSYRYIFFRTFVDFTGTYFNDSHCAVALSSDYAYLENNRTIDKAIRVGRAALLPLLNSPVLVNADGSITGNSIAIFRSALQAAADPMVRAGEISADGITIDPTQKILTTSNLYIKFQIVPTGTARKIIVNIGFAQSVSSS